MVNYACTFSESELGKYFEWIINPCKTLSNFKNVILINILYIKNTNKNDPGKESKTRLKQERVGTCKCHQGLHMHNWMHQKFDWFVYNKY